MEEGRAATKTVRTRGHVGLAGTQGATQLVHTHSLHVSRPYRAGFAPLGSPRRRGSPPRRWLLRSRGSSWGGPLLGLALFEVAPQLPRHDCPSPQLALAHRSCWPQRGASRPGGEPAPSPPGLASRLKAHASPCPRTSLCWPRPASRPAVLRFAPAVLCLQESRPEENRLLHFPAVTTSSH